MTTLPPLWTCPDLDNDAAIAAFEQNPARLRDALAGLSDSDLRAHPIDGKWSIKQIAVHIVDTELMAAGRFRQTITQSEPTFPFWDQEIWTETLCYQDVPPAELDSILSLYAALRTATAHLLRRLPAETWRLAGLHQKRGPMTIRQLLDHHTVHCERHLKQILDRRTLLGKPLPLEPLPHVLWE